MKSIPTFLLFLATMCCFVGCYESKPAPKYPIDGAVDLNQQAPAASPAAPGAEPAQNSAGVWHYTCSNGCAGGAGAEGNCATCGNALAHNSTYHNNTGAPTPTPTPAPSPTTTETATSNITFSGDPANPEPAQNAAGVGHYTCSAGCAGGAGAAGTCASCGGALAHNSGYH